jgi:hypothetical protein
MAMQAGIRTQEVNPAKLGMLYCKEFELSRVTQALKGKTSVHKNYVMLLLNRGGQQQDSLPRHW